MMATGLVALNPLDADVNFTIVDDGLSASTSTEGSLGLLVCGVIL